MRRLSLRALICRMRGHAWQVAEIPGYHPDGRVFVQGRRRLCARCPARADVPGEGPRMPGAGP